MLKSHCYECDNITVIAKFNMLYIAASQNQLLMEVDNVNVNVNNLTLLMLSERDVGEEEEEEDSSQDAAHYNNAAEASKPHIHRHKYDPILWETLHMCKFLGMQYALYASIV